MSNAANIYFDFNAPVITQPAAFTVDDATAFTEMNEHKLRILPNPAQEMITLVLDASWQGMLRADVMDLTGRIALIQRMPASHAILDIAALRSGAYQVCIRDGDGRMLTGRFVKR